MADNGLDEIPKKCPHCASSQADLLCVCSAVNTPILVVEMSQTSSIGSADIFASQERRKEKSASREPSTKDLVTIEDSSTQIDSPSFFISFPRFPRPRSPCQLIHWLLKVLKALFISRSRDEQSRLVICFIILPITVQILYQDPKQLTLLFQQLKTVYTEKTSFSNFGLFVIFLQLIQRDL